MTTSRSRALAWLVCLLVALTLAASAHGQVGAAHQNLGDDTLESEPRDVPGDLAPLPAPLATPSQPGCVTDLIETNFSSRAGARPIMNVAHLTVSRNSAGWGDVNAIRGWFNQARAQASSNYIIDAEGNCKLIVPETAKAWTQGAANPVSISIEFIHFSPTDPREEWTEAQLRKGARVFADSSGRWGIPIRLVNPEGCTWIRGLTDHDRLECRNSHVDVGTRQPGAGVHVGTFPMTKFLRYVREATAPPEPAKVLVWRVAAGGEILHQRKVVPGDRPTTYERVMSWMRSHPAPVGAAEKEHNYVSVRKIAAAVS